ncbi:MFS transporter [Cryobacterium sp. TMT1-3]|uniref:MFS transporter n=1 Tax=Cryobacterium luteum TaxID=1424661 RepID=A0A1H8JBM7_9MICO|nr:MULTISPECIES: MFS transporter [Cryobacterium]TFB92357.1 MFS transporter [Cryobacterium luteum]TFC25087.1 MFS transporter [Cryobacterium sp. TMT1-3]SEN77716.1 Predicted arabinose efflux permease, MFS family [Cryobacterium luteum]
MTPAHPGRGAASAGWNGHSHGSSDYRKLLAGLFFAGIATFAQLYSPQAVLARIADDIGVSAADAALVISASTLGLAVGVIPWSLVADRLGRVRAMSIAVIAATVFGLLVPFAPTFSLLLTGRFVEGLMLGGVPAIAIAYLSEEIEPRHAARAAGTYVAGTSIGGLLGRLVAGPITELAHWRVGVFAVGVLCAVAAVLFITLVPAPRGFVPRRFVPRRARERGSDPGLVDLLRANLSSPRLLALYAQGFLLMGGFVALYNYLGFRLAHDPFNLPQALISLVFVAYLAGTWSSAQAGILAARFGRWWVLISSLACMTAGVLLTLSTVLVLVLLGVLLATAGFFAAHAVASGWTGAEARIGRAQASSLYNLAYYAGSSLFGWLGGVFFVQWGWGGTVGMVAGLAVLAAVVTVAALRPPQNPAHTTGFAGSRSNIGP